MRRGGHRMDRTRWTVAAVATALVLAGATACGDDGATAGVDGPPPDGAALWAESCASCHGAALEGTVTGPPLLSELYEPGRHPDELIVASIRQGAPQVNWSFGPMPIVGGLSDADVAAIVAHVREVQATEGVDPFPPD